MVGFADRRGRPWAAGQRSLIDRILVALASDAPKRITGRRRVPTPAGCFEDARPIQRVRLPYPVSFGESTHPPFPSEAKSESPSGTIQV